MRPTARQPISFPVSSGSLGQRLGNAFEGFALGVYAEPDFDNSSNEQEHRRDEIAKADIPRRTGFDQIAEHRRRDAAAGGRAERIETGDRECTRLEGEYL